MSQAGENMRPKAAGGARRETRPGRGRGGAAPLEAQQAGEPQVRRLEWRQLERWENEGGAIGAARALRKAH